MRRRLLLSAWLCFALIGMGIVPLAAQEADQTAANQSTQEADQQATDEEVPGHLTAAELKAGLRTVTKEQDAFIDYIVFLANTGNLSYAVIDSAYDYSQQKPKKKRFEYFRRVIFLLAEKVGTPITWPPEPETATTEPKSRFGKYFSVLLRLIPWWESTPEDGS